MTNRFILSSILLFVVSFPLVATAASDPEIKIQKASYNLQSDTLRVEGKLKNFSDPADVGLIGVGPGWIANLASDSDGDKKFNFSIPLDELAPPCSVTVEAGGLSASESVDRGSESCEPYELTIAGLVVDDPIPFATVSVTVGGVTYTTVADENGAYSVDIASILFDDLVLIEADFADDTDADLISVGSFAKYLETSDNGVVTEGTNVTNVTSAMFLAVVEANGGAAPTTVEELVEAETHVDATEVIEIAAVIKMILDVDVGVPVECAGLPLLDCVSSPGVVDTVIADNPVEFAEVVEEILEDNDLVPGFAEVPARYYSVRTSEPGFLPRGGELMDFGESDGTLYTATNLALPAPVEFNWSIDLGVLKLEFPDYPLVRWSISLAFLAGQHPEAVMDDGAALLGGVGEPDCTVDMVGDLNFPEHRVLELERRLTKINDGISIDSASVEKRIEMRDFDPVECSDGVVRTLQPLFNIAVENQLLQENTSVNGQPFTASLAEGSWAMTFYYDTEVLGAVERRFAGDVVTFNNDGTVAADSSDSSSWSWAVSGDDVVLDYGDGWTQRMSIINSLDPDGAAGNVTEYLVFSVFEGPGPDDRLATSDVAVEADPLLMLSELNLVNDPGYFWNGMINSWQPSYWADGVLLVDNYFGWRIQSAGAGGQAFYAPFLNCGGVPGDPAWWVRPFGDGGMPATGWTTDAGGNLDMPYRNGFRVRSWVPVQSTTREDGIRIFYVFESESEDGLTRFPPRLNVAWELEEPTDVLCELEF